MLGTASLGIAYTAYLLDTNPETFHRAYEVIFKSEAFTYFKSMNELPKESPTQTVTVVTRTFNVPSKIIQPDPSNVVPWCLESAFLDFALSVLLKFLFAIFVFCFVTVLLRTIRRQTDHDEGDSLGERSARTSRSKLGGSSQPDTRSIGTNTQQNDSPQEPAVQSQQIGLVNAWEVFEIKPSPLQGSSKSSSAPTIDTQNSIATQWNPTASTFEPADTLTFPPAPLRRASSSITSVSSSSMVSTAASDTASITNPTPSQSQPRGPIVTGPYHGQRAPTMRPPPSMQTSSMMTAPATPPLPPNLQSQLPVPQFPMHQYHGTTGPFPSPQTGRLPIPQQQNPYQGQHPRLPPHLRGPAPLQNPYQPGFLPPRPQ